MAVEPCVWSSTANETPTIENANDIGASTPVGQQQPEVADAEHRQAARGQGEAAPQRAREHDESPILSQGPVYLILPGGLNQRKTFYCRRRRVRPWGRRQVDLAAMAPA